MQPNLINPEEICQSAIQAKLNAYQARENADSVCKIYNDKVDALINLVGIMRNKILELENELEKVKMTQKKETTTSK